MKPEIKDKILRGLSLVTQGGGEMTHRQWYGWSNGLLVDVLCRVIR